MKYFFNILRSTTNNTEHTYDWSLLKSYTPSKMLTRSTLSRLVNLPKLSPHRNIHNINVPFQDDLTPAELDDFNLGDFQHYQPSPDTIAHTIQPTHQPDPTTDELTALTQLKEPMVFISKLTNPYLNLALEDFIYTNMPKPQPQPTTNVTPNYNRLVFYINSPCVVIGKNQNPWKEVNIPLLNSLKLPLLRRRSGGGTVVHDLGNVNYSFMTTKDNFDRFRFANMIVSGVNKEDVEEIMVNDRGDIITKSEGKKISGSAYKLSKGKSYHHGTMLLNSNLEVLRKVLHRDDGKLGVVDAMNSISSVKSPVVNLGMDPERFIQVVSDEFRNVYGRDTMLENPDKNKEDGELDQDELFGFNQFVNPSIKTCKVITVADESMLPQQVHDTADELRQWGWKFGNTPQFSHTLTNHKFNFKVIFHVDRHAIIDRVELIGATQEIENQFMYLNSYIKEHRDVEYVGSTVAGFITNDEISEWVGQCIDGSV